MKVKRLCQSLAVAGTLTALTVGTALPALASTFNIAITPNTSQAIPGSTDPHAIPISVSVSTDCNLVCSTNLSVSVTGPDPVPAPAPVSNNQSSASLNFTWDSKPQSSHNGVYTVSANASEGGLGSGSKTVTMALNLNNPPSAPSGINSALDASGTPVVSWSANPEPDIKGYQVYRSDTGSTPLVNGLITGTSYKDDAAPKGQAVTYKVAALRYSPVDSSGMISSATSVQSGPVTAPAPAAVAQAVPQNIATVDPPPAPKTSGAKAGATAPSSVNRQALTFNTSAPTPISGPTLPTRVLQLPQPNVVQFAPLLPYSGKIPEVPVTTNVPAPVAAQAGDAGSSSSIALPGGVKVTPVDAVKYVATAAFLIVAAVHITRFARKLRNAPV